MYQRILVPLDGSDYSECIISHVKAIATGCSVPEVDLLMVVEPLSTQVYDIPDDWKEDAQKKAVASTKDYLSKVAGEMSKAGITVNARVAQGSPAEEILDYVKKNKIDLIMLSSHGRSGVTRWALGSVADRVIRQSPVPVLVATPAECQLGERR